MYVPYQMTDCLAKPNVRFGKRVLKYVPQCHPSYHYPFLSSEIDTEALYTLTSAVPVSHCSREWCNTFLSNFANSSTAFGMSPTHNPPTHWPAHCIRDSGQVPQSNKVNLKAPQAKRSQNILVFIGKLTDLKMLYG